MLSAAPRHAQLRPGFSPVATQERKTEPEAFVVVCERCDGSKKTGAQRDSCWIAQKIRLFDVYLVFEMSTQFGNIEVYREGVNGIRKL